MRYYLLKLFNIVFLSFFLAGCDDGIDPIFSDVPRPEGEIELYVDHYKPSQTRYRTSLNENSTVYEDNEILGFEYEWGFKYKLKVDARTKLAPIIAFEYTEYTFLEELTKTKVDTDIEFEIIVDNVKDIEPASEQNIYRLIQDKDFYCDTDQCALIESYLNQDVGMLFLFNHGSEPDLPLLLVSIECIAPKNTFRVECL